MKVIVLVLIVVASAHCDSINLVDFRLSLHHTQEPTTTCDTAGLLCESCSDLVSCVHNSDNTWTKINVETCPSGQKCLKGACTTESDPLCDGIADLPFPCQAVGIFPDPFYCNKFVMCVPISGKLQAYNSKCEEGLGYNIGTGMCDVKLVDGKCPDGYPVPLCQKAGQSEALEKQPVEYYTCEQYSSTKSVLYPFIAVCPHADPYANYQCGV